MILSIVMPTIDGRQDELVRTVAMYERLTPREYGNQRERLQIEWIVETGHNNCGAAWNAGVNKATGDIVHMGADDIEPENIAWFHAAMTAIDRGNVPLGLVREGSTKFGRDFARVVICRREWWRDVPEIHYWSDNAFDDLMRADDHVPMVVPGFDFYHRKSMVGRDESPPRLAADHAAYMKQRS